jgi:predicted phage terminase large subunit-like protein
MTLSTHEKLPAVCRPSLQVNAEITNAMYRQSLWAFVQAALPELIPDYRDYDYVRLVAAYFEDLLLPRRHGRLVITMPPRHGKSYILIAVIAWFLATYPDREVMLIGHSRSLTTDLAGKLKAFLETPFFRRIFPHFSLMPGREAMTDFRTTEGGCFLAASFEMGTQGRGADLLLIDDSITARNAQSPLERKNVIDTFENTLALRMNDPSNNAIVSFSHRYHTEDLPGHLIGLGYPHLCLPFRAVSDEPIVFRGVRLSREIGETLQNDLSPEAFAHIDSLPPHVYATQFQQRPMAREAGTIKRAHFPIVDSAPSDGEFVISWDCASSTSPGASRSVALVFQQHGPVSYLVHISSGRVDYTTLKATALALQERYEPVHHIIEATSTGVSLLDDLKGRANAIPMKMNGASKIERLDAVMGKIVGQHIHIVRNIPGLEDFLEELTAFPHGSHDDQVDALTQYLKWKAEFEPLPAMERRFLRVDRPRNRFSGIKKMIR